MAKLNLTATFKTKNIFIIKRIAMLIRYQITGPKILRTSPSYFLAICWIRKVQVYWISFYGRTLRITKGFYVSSKGSG